MTAGIKVSIALEGDAEVARRLRSTQAEAQRQERGAMHRALVTLKTEAQGRIYSPEGRARRGIGYAITGAGDTLRGTLRSRSTAAIFSQRGRGAGKRMPPLKAIARWLKRIGQNTTPSSAFLVARAIAERGRRGHPIMAASLAAKQSEVVAIFRDMIRAAVRGGK